MYKIPTHICKTYILIRQYITIYGTYIAINYHITKKCFIETSLMQTDRNPEKNVTLSNNHEQ